MNDIIKTQLSLCGVAKVPDFTDKTTHIIIPKTDTKKSEDISVGKQYILELAQYIIKPYDGFDLHKNWNNNIPPKDKYLKCKCVQTMGKMLKVDGVGFDVLHGTETSNTWTGWLPQKGVTIIKEI